MPAAPRVTRKVTLQWWQWLHQGQAHLPIQLSCLDVRQAVWLTAREQQEISLSTERQTWHEFRQSESSAACGYCHIITMTDFLVSDESGRD